MTSGDVFAILHIIVVAKMYNFVLLQRAANCFLLFLSSETIATLSILQVQGVCQTVACDSFQTTEKYLAKKTACAFTNLVGAKI